MNKFLIILAYYKRPELVLNAINSIKNLQYENWQLDFIDDSGDNNFQDILLNFGFDNSKVNYIPINDTDEVKKSIGGSRHGHFMNESIKNSDADIVIILCDDDAILPNYLEDLNEYYTVNQNIVWAYSKVKYYIPNTESYLQAKEDFERVRHIGVIANLNINMSPINPDCKCDSSQVTFRRLCFTEKNIWYPYPQTKNLDSAIYNRMYQVWGNCHPTNIYGQCKGVFSEQLGARSNDFEISIK